MNIITETKRRMEYLNKELIELKECLNASNISFLARDHLNNEIAKTEKNIQYYSEILEKLNID